MNRRWRLLGSLLLASVLLILALPYVFDAYHLQAGGQALERALGRHDALDWWYIGPREVQDPLALDAAIAHLERADRAPYALRLLGQAFIARGDVLRSVRALEQFVERRPKHHLAQLELAAAYVYADERLPELEYFDLLEHLDQASVSAPDLAEPTRYLAEEWRNEYVYPTTYSLPPEYGDRPTLFVHAGSQVAWTVSLTEPSVLRFGMSQAPESLDWGGDGATFEVWIDGERVFLEHLPIERAREGWHEREVDLASYTGQTLQLALATTPGPKGDVTGDWAGWGEPRLEAVDAYAYRETVKRQPWRAKWHEMGVQAADWIKAGEAARAAGQYETALAWYRWTDRLSSDSGTKWYYYGLVYRDQGQWTRALDAFARAADSESLRNAPLSGPHYQAGVIYQLRLPSPQLETAIKSYDHALAVDDFENDWQMADCHHKRAEALLALGEYTEAIDGFRRAIEIYPRHSGAHLLLGMSLYERDGDFAAAEASLLTAIELAPNGKWGYYQLGRIYDREGKRDQAEPMYVRALTIDPDFAAAKAHIEALRK